MISENCSIDEFVEAVKERAAWDVVSLAVDEATQAERRFHRARRCHDDKTCCSRDYSAQLKQLINYLRFAIKPKRPQNRAYRLYMANWGTVDEALPTVPGSPRGVG